MDYTLLGLKFNVINVILCVALGFLICAMIGYNNNNIIEGAERNSDSKRPRPPQPYKGKGVGKPKLWLLSYTKMLFDR